MIRMSMARLNKDDISHFIDNDLYVSTRTIYIGPMSSSDYEVNAMMAERAIKNLHILDSKAQAPIEIISLNYGGGVVEGMAIYDAIRLCRSEVTMKIFGCANSMGSIILQAADKRLLAPNAEVMIHYGFSSYGENHPKANKSALRQAEKYDKWMVDMYLEKIQEKKPKFKRSQLDKWLNFDKYLSAEEAVEFGLADAIIETHLDK